VRNRLWVFARFNQGIGIHDVRIVTYR
jgi:hypothetical protein